jgi:hypothetical protein
MTGSAKQFRDQAVIARSEAKQSILAFLFDGLLRFARNGLFGMEPCQVIAMHARRLRGYKVSLQG